MLSKSCFESSDFLLFIDFFSAYVLTDASYIGVKSFFIKIKCVVYQKRPSPKNTFWGKADFLPHLAKIRLDPKFFSFIVLSIFEKTK